MTEEKTGIEFIDSVMVGDIHQNTLKTDVCPSCSASNVRVMKCQEVGCTSKQFCELCHPNCRYSGGSVTRFDSGLGSGPLCSECLTAKITQFNLDKQERERLERERLERERLEREILAREAQAEQERKRQGVILYTKQKQREAQKKHRITTIIWVFFLTGMFFFIVLVMTFVFPSMQPGMEQLSVPLRFLCNTICLGSVLLYFVWKIYQEE